MVVLYVSGNRIGTWAEGEHIVAELAAKQQEIEVRDEAGRTLGRFVPTEPFPDRAEHPRLAISDVDRLADEKIHEHLAYLRRLADQGVVSAALANTARVVWNLARLSTNKPLPVPAAAAFPGGPIEYHWSVGPHQLLAEIPTPGLCHWTYQNKNTGELWGEETPTDDKLPTRLERILSKIADSAI